MTQVEGHIEPDDLAQLVAGREPAAVQDRVERHMAECRQCAALYAELAREQLGSTFGIHPPMDREWLELGFAAGHHGKIAMLRDTRRTARRRVLLAAAVAGSAILAASTALLLRSRPPSADSVPADHAVVAQLAREDSYGGLLYSAQLLPDVRSTRGGVPDDVQIDAIRARLAARATDPDAAFWLIVAGLATNQLRRSELHLTEALRSFPSDARFENLAAILAFKQDDLRGAERHLRRAMVVDRSGVAQVNLVHVLSELGETAEARAIAARVRQDHPDLASAAGL